MFLYHPAWVCLPSGQVAAGRFRCGFPFLRDQCSLKCSPEIIDDLSTPGAPYSNGHDYRLSSGSHGAVPPDALSFGSMSPRSCERLALPTRATREVPPLLPGVLRCLNLPVCVSFVRQRVGPFPVFFMFGLLALHTHELLCPRLTSPVHHPVSQRD